MAPVNDDITKCSLAQPVYFRNLSGLAGVPAIDFRRFAPMFGARLVHTDTNHTDRPPIRTKFHLFELRRGEGTGAVRVSRIHVIC